ncbi:hypothetical protein KCP78_08655 [Salmonella enterica subsp. enterica]|nr:hypothetical protein KCP78_08655 [Salmonella enterica subsp. enterica]
MPCVTLQPYFQFILAINAQADAIATVFDRQTIIKFNLPACNVEFSTAQFYRRRSRLRVKLAETFVSAIARAQTQWQNAKSPSNPPHYFIKRRFHLSKKRSAHPAKSVTVHNHRLPARTFRYGQPPGPPDKAERSSTRNMSKTVVTLRPSSSDATTEHKRTKTSAIQSS